MGMIDQLKEREEQNRPVRIGMIGGGKFGTMFMALAQKQINLEMITQGASAINISCVIQQEDAPEALRIIHQAFLESNTETNASS